MVTLQEFVRETLRQVARDRKADRAVSDRRDGVPPGQWRTRTLSTTVKFDVVVNAESKKKADVGGGVQIAVFSAKTARFHDSGESNAQGPRSRNLQSSLSCSVRVAWCGDGHLGSLFR